MSKKTTVVVDEYFDNGELISRTTTTTTEEDEKQGINLSSIDAAVDVSDRAACGELTNVGDYVRVPLCQW